MSVPSPLPAYSLVREGLHHQHASRAAEAARCYERALALEPANFDALHFLGVVRFRTGECDAGIALLERALALHPNHPPALNNLGNALRAAGRLAEAVTVYRRAVALCRPPRALFLRNLGSAQLEMGEWADAAGNLRCAAALNPNDSVVWCWMGHLERALDRPEAALAAYEKALALEPGLIEARRGRGCVYRNSGRAAEARAEYAQVLAAVPRHVLARSLYADVSLCIADWDGWSEHAAAVATATPVPADLAEPYSIHFMTDDPVVLRRHSEAAAGLAQSAAPTMPNAPRSRTLTDRRLRVAYLSADIREHPVGRLVAGVMEEHDRSQLEITVYALGSDDKSPARRRVVAAAEHFEPLETVGDRELAERIAADEQDILIDLMGHTAGNRVRVLAAHPASLQASWLGYPGTLGGSLVDYFITDGFTSPPGSEANHSEQLVRLPHTCLPGDPSQSIGSAPPRSAFDLSDDAVVLCSFGQTRKLNPHLFDIWMDVLRAVPAAVLWLREEHPLATANLRREAERRAIDGERLVFTGRVASVGDYLARYQVADLVLDTFPYASHSTAADALWAGCPIVALAGRSFASRVCGSLLRGAGMPELVTEGIDEYRALAVKLARDATARAELRARIAAARRSVPLFDIAAFTRSLERAYSAMGERARQGLPPTHIWVT